MRFLFQFSDYCFHVLILCLALTCIFPPIPQPIMKDSYNCFILLHQLPFYFNYSLDFQSQTHSNYPHIAATTLMAPHEWPPSDYHRHIDHRDR